MDYASFSSSLRVTWLKSSSRVDSSMRGSFISSLMRASVACLVSGFGLFLYIPYDVTRLEGLQVNLEQGRTVSEIIFIPSSFDQSGPIREL
jgi:hypothetical protein